MGQGSARGYFDGWRRVKYVDFVLSTIASGGFSGITSQELVFSLSDSQFGYDQIYAEDG